MNITMHPFVKSKLIPSDVIHCYIPLYFDNWRDVRLVINNYQNITLYRLP